MRPLLGLDRIVCNTFRRISLQRTVDTAPEESRQRWWVFFGCIWFDVWANQIYFHEPASMLSLADSGCFKPILADSTSEGGHSLVAILADCGDSRSPLGIRSIPANSDPLNNFGKGSGQFRIYKSYAYPVLVAECHCHCWVIAVFLPLQQLLDSVAVLHPPTLLRQKFSGTKEQTTGLSNSGGFRYQITVLGIH